MYSKQFDADNGYSEVWLSVIRSLSLAVGYLEGIMCTPSRHKLRITIRHNLL
jgi:hypothetical protein